VRHSCNNNLIDLT